MAVETRTFAQRLRAAQESQGSLLCVGLDPDIARFPDGVARSPKAVAGFNRAIIEATADLACCYKPNMGFYLQYGIPGVEALARLRDDVPAHIPVLLDAKLGDISVTSTGYARAVFETWRYDAVTVNPFLGRDSLEPFLVYPDRAIFVLAKTSNPGSGMLQDRLLVGDDGGETVTMAVVRHARDWSSGGNVGLVAGATWPRQLAEIRQAAPELPILIPGVGAQEGDLAAAVTAGLDADGYGILVNASRAISYASSGRDFQEAARTAATALRDAINAARAISS
ncbi:MAG TPA: orotidine-5'-phosphate decarboxylase [Thermomicrobiales bacterium]|nr:orotidine-5'-phosphate decarboxylase [Thermomicrobiales bacterium]